MPSEPAPSGLSRAQIDAITLVERISSGFSLAGLTFIIVSFICIPAIRKPIHRLMFYAAWGDIFYNIATLIATAGIDAGQGSFLCQFQGFTIEMFLWTDTLWNLAMAVDVYLTVFRRYDNQKLRGLEKWYIIGIYGFSFLLAFVLCFAKDSERGNIYGPAVLWCWISLEWDFMRIVMLYGPVWVMIAAIWTIYIFAGIEIYRKDREIRYFSRGNSSVPVTSVDSESNHVHISTDTTISMTAGERPDSTAISWHGTARASSPANLAINSPTSPRVQRSLSPDNAYEQYSVMVEPSPLAHRAPKSVTTTVRTCSDVQVRRELNSAAWAYTKCASLFFVALLITWLPSTINRVYALIYPENVVWSLNLSAAIVLPLMGFWNTCIYIITSWSTLRAIFGQLSFRLGESLPSASDVESVHRDPSGPEFHEMPER